MYIDIISVDKEPLVCQLKGYLTAPETIIIILVGHLYTEASVFLSMGVERWGDGFYSPFLQVKLIVYSHDPSHDWHWGLLKCGRGEIVLVLLLHLFCHFLHSSVLHTLTRLEQVPSHYL